ncbi:MAG: hypothetical protein IT356_03110 [Gemmatimonadaceae bacterium]|nr:hypothetical protein [Gemmatimonadaceae bacterium]
MTAGRYTDFHNHLMPAVDDGARDASAAEAALDAFRRAGAGQVIATPHLDGSLTRQPGCLAARMAELDAGWGALCGAVAADAQRHASPMRVERGAEVMLDIPDPDLSDPRTRLAGTRFALVEFARLRLPPVNAASAIAFIRRSGWLPVVAHPERYRNLESMDELEALRAAGAFFQVNAGSLLGEYGSTAQRHVMAVLRAGMASYACSDYHATGEPATARAVSLLAEAGFGEQADLLFAVNPGRLLRGDLPLPVPPVARRAASAASWWKRLLGG